MSFILSQWEINVLLFAMFVFCYLCTDKYSLLTSHGIPAMNYDEIELKIKRDLPLS